MRSISVGSAAATDHATLSPGGLRFHDAFRPGDAAASPILAANTRLALTAGTVVGCYTCHDGPNPG